MGSYEPWARVVGGILAVAGIDGFLDNRAEIYAQATAEGEAWRTLLDLWWQEHGDQRVGVDQIIEIATHHKLLTDLRAGRTDRGARTALGMELARLRDRVVGPYRVRGAGVSGDSGAARYQLERTQPPDGGSEAERESDSESVEGREKVTEGTEVTADPRVDAPEPTEPTEPFPAPRQISQQIAACPRCGSAELVYDDAGALVCRDCGELGSVGDDLGGGS